MKGSVRSRRYVRGVPLEDRCKPRAADLKAGGNWLADKIRARTEAGLDERRRKFAPYSPSYAASKGVSPDNVTLRASGEMLDSLGVISTAGHSVKVGMTTPESIQKAKWNERTKDRKFLSVPASWLKGLMEVVMERRRTR